MRNFPEFKVKKFKPAMPRFEKYTKEPKEEDVPGLINGVQAGSKEEWWVAEALWSFNMTFDYQYSVYGGYGARGGQVIDFLVHTVPTFTPIYVMGRYWHKGSKVASDFIKIQDLKRYFGASIRDPEVWWTDKELTSKEAAMRMVRMRLL